MFILLIKSFRNFTPTRRLFLLSSLRSVPFIYLFEMEFRRSRYCAHSTDQRSHSGSMCMDVSMLTKQQDQYWFCTLLFVSLCSLSFVRPQFTRIRQQVQLSTISHDHAIWCTFSNLRHTSIINIWGDESLWSANRFLLLLLPLPLLPLLFSLIIKCQSKIAIK